MRHFTATITQRDLDLVAFFQKPQQVSEFDLVIALIGAGAKLHFFNYNLLLLEFGFMQPLTLAVFELSKIHHTTYRRTCRWCNLYQIQLCLFRELQSSRDTDNTDLFTTCTNNPDFRCVNLRIDPGFFFLCYAITP